MTDYILKVNDLKKYFKVPNGMLHAVDGVNFTVERGKTLGVVGESGCGKTTLGRLVLRLVDLTDGKIIFNDEDIYKFNKKQLRIFRQNMQIIFQDPNESINPRMSVGEIIAEALIVNNLCKNKKEMEEKILELMETVGLADRLVNSYPHELDGGRRQRIGIARALAVKPQFIVCDEPVSALDVSIQAQILNLMQDLQSKRNLSYLFITHNLSVVKHMADEIIVMYLGQVVEKAPSEDLFSSPFHPYTIALLDAITIPSLSSRNKKRDVIRGEITSPINPKKECRFVNRCPVKIDRCSRECPTLKEISRDHYVACFVAKV